MRTSHQKVDAAATGVSTERRAFFSGKTGKALAQTALTAVLWGTSFPVISIGLKGGLDPRTFVFLRFAIAAPLMAAIGSALGRPFTPLLRRKEVWIIGLLNAAGFLCQFVGQQYTDASVAALLVNLSVVMAAIGSVLFLNERFGALKVLGISLAVAGTVMITTNGSLSSLSGGEALGDGLYLAAAVAWAGYIVYAKKKTDQLQWDPFALATGIVIVTAVAILPVEATARIGDGLGYLPLQAILYTAVLNTAVPFVLYQQGLRYLSASTSAVVLTLEIVVAVALSVFFLGETLTAIGWTGALLILFSVVLVSGLEIGRKRR